MSRLEKTLEKKSKRKKIRTISKIAFIFFLAVNATVCVFVVDINAKKMLGQDIKIQDAVNHVKVYLENTIENINDLSENIKAQINR